MHRNLNQAVHSQLEHLQLHRGQARHCANTTSDSSCRTSPGASDSSNVSPKRTDNDKASCLDNSLHSTGTWDKQHYQSYLFETLLMIVSSAKQHSESLWKKCSYQRVSNPCKWLKRQNASASTILVCFQKKATFLTAKPGKTDP